jgi:histidine triad (HIT) family protein
LLLQKNGVEVGQSVPHVHFHYLPRKLGYDLLLKFLVQIYIPNIKKLISSFEIEKIAKKMKEAID